MPTVLRVGPYRFHFYSDERGEPTHIHVRTSDGECKFWLEPIALAKNQGLAAHVVRTIEALVFEHQEYLREKYNEYHRS
jgi:Pyruvate/2-oxoacid:ferredoxin oxidoreductase gamma subunit